MIRLPRRGRRRLTAGSRRRIGVAAAGLVLVVVGQQGTAAAADARLTDAGWWWRAQSGLGLPLPPPPTVEAGQLPVEGSPGGPVSIAAVRFSLPEGTDGARLTLALAENSPTPGLGAVILACPPTRDWYGVEAGVWDTRPEADCGKSVPGMPSDDGATWSFELGLLRDGDGLDVVLVPGTIEGVDTVGATFSVVFDRPGSDAVTVSGSGSELPVSEPDLGVVDASPEPPVDELVVPPLGGDAAFTPPAAPVASPAPGDAESGSDAVRRPERVSAPLVSTARTGARTLGLLLLLGAGAAALWGMNQPVPPLRALSRFAAHASGGVLGGPISAADHQEPGGLGRFARPRTGVPPTLR